MDALEPTVLHHPADQSSSSGADSVGVGSLALAMVLVPIVIVALWGLRLFLRKKGMTANERAFRGLCRRMRLKPNQIIEIKQYADKNAHCDPLAVVMNQTLLQEAIGPVENLGGGSSEEPLAQSEKELGDPKFSVR